MRELAEPLSGGWPRPLARTSWEGTLVLQLPSLPSLYLSFLFSQVRSGLGKSPTWPKGGKGEVGRRLPWFIYFTDIYEAQTFVFVLLLPRGAHICGSTCSGRMWHCVQRAVPTWYVGMSMAWEVPLSDLPLSVTARAGVWNVLETQVTPPCNRVITRASQG